MPNIINGHDYSEAIDGTAVSDYIFALGGNDTVDGLAGNDLLFGGEGDDKLFGATGGDILDGGAGNDVLGAGTANDALYGGAGSDRLFGETDSDVLGGGAGDDMLDGGSENDTLYGGDGSDKLFGGYGSDVLEGGAGDDVLAGDAGYVGDSGPDTIDYHGVAPSPSGETIRLFAGTLTSGNGSGFSVGLAYGTADGGAGHDELFGIENVIGSGFADDITGDASANALYGKEGNDKLTGGAGADKLDGGTGFDTVYYGTSKVGVVVQLDTGTAHNGEAEGDTLAAIEAVSGSYSDDGLYGNGGANRLDGLGGHDLLSGNAGNDALTGGAGQDDFYGGVGADRFIFNAVSDSPTGVPGRDVIHDFNQAAFDTIDLHAIDAMPRLTGNQALTWIGTDPLTETGQLHVVYGRGGVAIVEANVTGTIDPDFQIVVLGNHALAASDFIL